MSTPKEEEIRIQNGVIRRGDWPELFEALGGRRKPSEVLQTICRLANLGALVTRGVIPLIANREGGVKTPAVEIHESSKPEKVVPEQEVAIQSTQRRQGRPNTHSDAGGNDSLGVGSGHPHGGGDTKVEVAATTKAQAGEVAGQPKKSTAEEPKVGGKHTIDRTRGRGMAAMM